MCAVLSCFRHVWLFVIRWAVALQASLSMGFSRPRILEWVAKPSSVSIANCYLKSFYPMYFSCIYRSLGFPSISFLKKKSQQPSNSSQVKILGHVLQRRKGWHRHLMVSCSAAQRGKRSSLSSKVSPQMSANPGSSGFVTSAHTSSWVLRTRATAGVNGRRRGLGVAWRTSVSSLTSVCLPEQ